MKYSIAFLRKLCDSSFYHFVKIIGGSVPEAGGDIIKEIHKPICDFIQNSLNKRMGIAMARTWFKSTVFTRWNVVWEYLQNPECCQLVVSENERLVTNFMDWIQKQLLYNGLLRKVYWDRLKDVNENWTKKHTWSKTAMELPRKGIYPVPSIQAIGVGGAAQSGHYDIIHIDDLVGERAIESPSILDDAIRWFDNVDELLKKSDWTDADGSRIKIVGTHWAMGDFFCYIQEKYPEYQWKIVPCLKSTELCKKRQKPNIQYINNPNVTEGESNFPFFSTSVYEKMKSNPEKQIIFWCQHMNMPQSSEGFNAFEADWIRYYHFEKDENGRDIIVCDDDKEEFDVGSILWYGLIDPGGFTEKKLTKRSSRNAILVAGQPKNSIKKFVRYTWAKQLKTPSVFIDEIFKAHKECNVVHWKIETIAAQEYIRKDILEAAREKGVYLPISPMEANVTKDAKNIDIKALINPMFNGEIYIHRSMTELKAEIINYPNSFTVDLLDMLSKYYKFFGRRKKVAELEELNKKRNRMISFARNPVTGY